jgi:hypothetical protein
MPFAMVRVEKGGALEKESDGSREGRRRKESSEEERASAQIDPFKSYHCRTERERERGEAQARLLEVQTAKAHDTDQNAPHHAMPCYNGEDIMQNRN